MIISKTPFRMSFFGGGTDYQEFFKEYGGGVLTTTIDKYCYIHLRKLPPFLEYKNQLVYSKIERVNEIKEIEHPLVRETLKYLNMDRVGIIYDADLPARSGLGTSSSFAVGLLHAIHVLSGKYVDKETLAKEAIYVERVLCNESGGIQDQIEVAYGGINRINFNSSGFTVNPIIISEKQKKYLNQNLMLFFTGFSRISSEIAQEQKKETQNNIAKLKEMLQLVDDAEKILTRNEHIEEFGVLLDYTWKLKRGLTSKISTSDIDILYERAKKAGAIGGKLLGAGGGGFLLLYVPLEKQDYVRKELLDLIYVPFKFENEGTKILYYCVDENK